MFRANLIKWYVVMGLMALLETMVANYGECQGIILARNYDGTNYNGSFYVVGRSSSSGNMFSWGVNFTVSGTGDFNLTEVTMPIYLSFDSGHPNLENYKISIVNDVSGQPTGDLITSFVPSGLGTVSMSRTFDVSGIVHGGANYWLLFMPTEPDSGNIGWNFSYGPEYPGVGYLAERWSSSGVPDGDWTISAGSGSVQPGYIITGAAVVPEPDASSLFAFGAAAFAVCSRLLRRPKEKVKKGKLTAIWCYKLGLRFRDFSFIPPAAKQ